jgi:hypothetical protein
MAHYLRKFEVAGLLVLVPLPPPAVVVSVDCDTRDVLQDTQAT